MVDGSLYISWYLAIIIKIWNNYWDNYYLRNIFLYVINNMIGISIPMLNINIFIIIYSPLYRTTYKREKNLQKKWTNNVYDKLSWFCAIKMPFFPLADTWNFKIRECGAFAVCWKTCWRVLTVAIKSQRSGRLQTDKWARGRDARQTYGLHKKKER